MTDALSDTQPAARTGAPTAALDEYVISDDRSRLDFDRIHQWFTSSDAYWMKGVTREEIERAFAASAVVAGVYLGDEMVGVGRIITDGVTFAWMADAFVAAEHRGSGIGKRLTKWGVDWAKANGVRINLLVTRDAHGVYASQGFRPLKDPTRWMAYYVSPDAKSLPLT